jgi:hypothetical protein
LPVGEDGAVDSFERCIDDGLADGLEDLLLCGFDGEDVVEGKIDVLLFVALDVPH